MATIKSFDARSWITTNLPDGAGLTEATYSAVASFAVLWNYFEETWCNTKAGPAVLQGLTAGIDVKANLPAELRDALTYWTNRYVEKGSTNHLFDGLNFRPGDDRHVVELVLLGGSTAPRDQLLALLTIIYRLRNNLFHGLKTLSTLNDQRENLATACQALAGSMLLLK